MVHEKGWRSKEKAVEIKEWKDKFEAAGEKNGAVKDD